MSDSVWPHRWQPIRLPRPWDSSGKNTGAGCHFLLQCMKMKMKSESEVAQSCLTLSGPMDCTLPDPSTWGIFQARVLEWGAIAFSEWPTKTHQKMDESQKHNARWNKLNPKEFVLNEFIHVNTREQAKLIYGDRIRETSKLCLYRCRHLSNIKKLCS